MIKRIYKYELPFLDYATLDLPKGAKVLSAGNQKEKLCIWVLLDEEEGETDLRQFRVAGTGHPIVEEGNVFINTVSFAQGNLIFHIFELGE